MIFGYINSLDKLSIEQQKAWLQQRGRCERIFTEQRSREENNPKLEALTQELRQGDQLVVCSIYVFSMSLTNFLKFVEILNKKGVEFIALQEEIYDAKLIVQLSIFGNYTRKQRSRFGLSCRKRGQKGGREKGLSEKAKDTAAAAAALYQNSMPIKSILSALGIKSTDTLYSYLRYQGVEIGSKKQ